MTFKEWFLFAIAPAVLTAAVIIAIGNILRFLGGVQ